MKTPIKVIIKEPGKPAYYDELPNELEVLQATVDGYIETVTIAHDIVVICNRDAVSSGLLHNMAINGIDFCGTVIIAGVDADELSDIPKYMQDEADLREIWPELFDLTPPRVCPICKREYSTRPAISRRAPIEICPECGQKEALEDYWQACQQKKNAAREG